MRYNDDEFLWPQKYRPRTIDECILPEHTKKVFQAIVKSGQIPNLLLAGSAGTGKTTVAMALCEQLGADYMFINASKEAKIDLLRNQIQDFASSVSLNDATKKVIILDEADYSTNSQAFQPALRGMMEEFSSNCTYILTCNVKSKIMAPIQSRCQVIDYKYSKEELPNIQAYYFKRCLEILKLENIPFEKPVVAQLVQANFPDFRRILNILQYSSHSGKIDSDALVSTAPNFDELWKIIATKNAIEIRKWVGANSDLDPTLVQRSLYDTAETYIKDNNSLAQFILIVADYMYKSALVADSTVNLAALCTEISGTCKVTV